MTNSMVKAAVKAEDDREMVKEPVSAEKNQAADMKATEKKADTVAADAGKAAGERGKKNTTKTGKERKTTRGAKKKAAKEEVKPEVYVQYQGNEATIADVIAKAQAEFVAAGHRVSTIRDLRIYLKPEEFAAYYVINQKFAGRVDLF